MILRRPTKDEIPLKALRRHCTPWERRLLRRGHGHHDGWPRRASSDCRSGEETRDGGRDEGEGKALIERDEALRNGDKGTLKFAAFFPVFIIHFP